MFEDTKFEKSLNNEIIAVQKGMFWFIFKLVREILRNGIILEFFVSFFGIKKA